MAEPLLNKPEQQQMQSLDATFEKHDQVLVKQTMRGCVQECMGCEAKSEYKISGMDYQFIQTNGFLDEGVSSMPDEIYALEQSSFCMRCCWRDGRAMTINISAGSEEGGAPIAQFRKPCGCPLQWDCKVPDNEGEIQSISFPCCCGLPKLTGFTPDNEAFSESEYVCDQNFCVPKFNYSENGQLLYIVKPKTCCGGCCIEPTQQCSKKGFIVPFFFWKADNPEERLKNANGKHPKICKIWSGLKKECCSTADNFHTVFPDGADAKRKAGFLGLVFLIDFTIFERQSGQGVAVEIDS